MRNGCGDGCLWSVGWGCNGNENIAFGVKD